MQICDVLIAVAVVFAKLSNLFNFQLKNEASRANLNKNERIFKWRPFWNELYLTQLCESLCNKVTQLFVSYSVESVFKAIHLQGS